MTNLKLITTQIIQNEEMNEEKIVSYKSPQILLFLHFTSILVGTMKAKDFKIEKDFSKKC